MLLPVVVLFGILLRSVFCIECDADKKAKLIKAINSILGKAKDRNLGFGRPEGIRIDAKKSSVTPAALDDASTSIDCPSAANVFVITAKTKDANLYSFDVQGRFVSEDLLRHSRRRRKRMCPPIYVTGSSSKSSSSYHWSAGAAYRREKKAKKEKKKLLAAEEAKRKAALKIEQDKRETGGAPLAFKTCIRSIEIDFARDLPIVVGVGQADDESCTKISTPADPEVWDLKTILMTDNFIWNKNGFGTALEESEFGTLLTPEDRSAAEAVAKCYWKALKDKGFEAVESFPKATGSLALLCYKQDWSTFKLFPQSGEAKSIDGFEDEFAKCNQRNQEKNVASLEKARRIWKLIGDTLCNPTLTLKALAGMTKEDAGVLSDCTIKSLTKAGFKFGLTSPKPRRLIGQQFQCSKTDGRVVDYNVQEKVGSALNSDDTEKLNEVALIDDIIQSCVEDVLHYPTEKQQEKMTKEMQKLFDRGCEAKSVLEAIVAKLWGKA